MRWTNAVLVALLVGALVGCSDSDTPSEVQPEPTIDQKHLFDVYYVNFAWGYRLVGTYVDNQGYVVKYNHDFEQWFAEDFANLTEAELDEKYMAPYDTLGVIDPASLYEMYEKIVPASLGELSERESTGRDAGSSVRVCYRYDEETERYVRVLLSQTGDVTQTNFSEAASEIVDWLNSVLDSEQSSEDLSCGR